jgi:type IV pilus assembly protein PilY1
VDGSPEIGDAFIKFGGKDVWRTVLVSGLGAGGQGLFALDVTTPDQFKESNAADIVMWEFTDADDPDLGYVFGQPVIRKMANGKWAAIVAGGYNNSQHLTGESVCTDSTARDPAGCTTSSTGAAYLYIIFLNGPSGTNRTWVEGTDYVKIGIPSGTADSPNGLSQPLAADVNADGIVDYVYAGDLNGNLWKFDLTSTVPTNWASSSNQVNLFVATDSTINHFPQPITAKPEGTLHPSGQGFIITFGTGKYLETTDPFPRGDNTYQPQSFYGIWDKDDKKPISGQTSGITRSQLLEHDIFLSTGGTGTFRVVVPVSGKPDSPANDWSTDGTPPTADDSPPKYMGWFLDFPDALTTGERSVFRPILTSGRLIFTTLLPLTDACQFGGTSFTMVVDPTTGGRIDAPVLDINGNGQLNQSDKVAYGSDKIYASGVQSTIGITPTPTIIKTDNLGTGGISATGAQILGTSGSLVASSGILLAYALSAGSSGGNASTMIGLSAAGGRVSWRELLSQ